MAKGDVTYKVTDLHINRTGAGIDVSANSTKYVEDEDGTKQSIGSWTGSVSYPAAGFGSKTMSELQAGLVAEIKGKNPAVAAKTIT